MKFNLLYFLLENSLRSCSYVLFVQFLSYGYKVYILVQSPTGTRGFTSKVNIKERGPSPRRPLAICGHGAHREAACWGRAS
jgi:hypothetical protein